MTRIALSLCFISHLILLASCNSERAAQTSSVRDFAGTAREVSGLPYKILYDYYTIKFHRKQLLPENYVTGDTQRVQLDELAENVISRLESIKEEYDGNLSTANEIKTIYDLLDTYLGSLEVLAGNDYYNDFRQRSVDMGNKMNNLIAKLNSFPPTRVKLPLDPGQWLTSIVEFHGRNEFRAKQKNILKQYLEEADTLVQAINIHYHEIEMPIMESWFDEEKRMIRGQFKRSIAPYLQNANRHPDSTASIVAFEFFSKINPVYYDFSDQISRDQALIRQTAGMMEEMAVTHRSLRTLFDSDNKATTVHEEINELREKLAAIKKMFETGGNADLLHNSTQHEDVSKNPRGK